MVLATFVVILNETVMLNAIPRLTVEFSVTEGAAAWLSTIFLLAMAAVMPMTGWLIGRLGARSAAGLAMGVFCGGTFLAALAPTFGVLVAARAVQAVGTAVMVPLLMTTVMTVVAEGDRGRVMGRVALAISVAPAIGPTVSGLVLEYTSWRAIFAGVLPVALFVTVLVVRRLSPEKDQGTAPLDLLSAVLAAVGFAPLIYGLSELGGSDGPVPPLLAVVIGLGAVGAFVVRQHRLVATGGPFLDLRTLAHGQFRRSLYVLAIGYMAMLAALLVIPLHLQTSLGLSELESGLLLVPGGVVMGVLGPVVGRVMDRTGGVWLVPVGSTGMTVALLGLASAVGLDLGAGWILAGHLLFMASVALIFTPAFTAGLEVLPAALYAHGSSVLNTVQQVAGAAGIAVAMAVLSAGSRAAIIRGVDESAAFTQGVMHALAVLSGLAVVTVIIAASSARRARRVG